MPKCRRKTLYKELRRHLGAVVHRLAAQKESQIEEGHLMLDHVHMTLSTKILALTDALGNLVRFVLLPGRR